VVVEADKVKETAKEMLDNFEVEENLWFSEPQKTKFFEEVK
jgi:hypothetical protein